MRLAGMETDAISSLSLAEVGGQERGRAEQRKRRTKRGQKRTRKTFEGKNKNVGQKGRVEEGEPSRKSKEKKLDPGLSLTT